MISNTVELCTIYHLIKLTKYSVAQGSWMKMVPALARRWSCHVRCRLTFIYLFIFQFSMLLSNRQWVPSSERQNRKLKQKQRGCRSRPFLFFLLQWGWSTCEILPSALVKILKNCCGDYYIHHIYGFCAMIYNSLYFR